MVKHFKINTFNDMNLLYSNHTSEINTHYNGFIIYQF